jgi:hypothetical protein
MGPSDSTGCTSASFARFRARERTRAQNEMFTLLYTLQQLQMLPKLWSCYAVQWHHGEYKRDKSFNLAQLHNRLYCVRSAYVSRKYSLRCEWRHSKNAAEWTCNPTPPSGNTTRTLATHLKFLVCLFYYAMTDCEMFCYWRSAGTWWPTILPSSR